MRIVIVDRDAPFRDRLRTLLVSQGHQVAGEARDGLEAIRLTQRVRPDVVLMDMDLPAMEGLAATRRIHEAVPTARVVALGECPDRRHVLGAFEAGASGYVLKSEGSERFLRLLERVARGEPVLTPTVATSLLRDGGAGERPKSSVSDPDSLTDREAEVLERMARGVTSNRGLAAALEVSENTVKFHVRNVLGKLGLHNRAEAVGYALRSGLVRLSAGDAELGGLRQVS